MSRVYRDAIFYDEKIFTDVFIHVEYCTGGLFCAATDAVVVDAISLYIHSLSLFVSLSLSLSSLLNEKKGEEQTNERTNDRLIFDDFLT